LSENGLEIWACRQIYRRNADKFAFRYETRAANCAKWFSINMVYFQKSPRLRSTVGEAVPVKIKLYLPSLNLGAQRRTGELL
jgi:hypothetical protein